MWVRSSGTAYVMVLAGGLCWDCSQEFNRDFSHLKAWWGSESDSKSSFTWLASWCWLLGGGLSSLPHVLLHRAVWMSSTHSCWLPPEWVIQEKARQNPPCLLEPSLRGYTPSFPQYPVGYTDQLYPLWERTRQEHRYQEVRVIGSQFGSWLSHYHSNRDLK